MCKGFEQRDMLFKHIPYISRRSNPQIPSIVFYNRRNGKETEMRKSVKMVKICVPLAIFSMREYVILLEKLWQFLVKSASNANSGNVKRWEWERHSLIAFTAFSVF